MSRHEISRRQFIAGATASAAAVTIVPRHVLGGTGFQAPSDTLNIAAVGAGGMGGENAQELGGENIVAVCDVDFDYGNISFGGDQLGDFYLLSVEETQDLYKDVPTAVENTSWGRVKAALGK